MKQPVYAMNQPNFAEMYERWLVGPLFRPWVDALLDRVGLAAGDRVLDLACGTGIVARLAKDRLGNKGRVVGVDLSPQMLAVGRSLAPSIEWREGDAVALPFGATEQFDVVVCQQGLQFFSDKAAAAREMRRILAPGGRVAVAAWCSMEQIPFFMALYRVAERHLGAVIDQRYSLGDAAVLGRLLADSGFHDVHVETMSRTVRFADGALFVRLNAMALVGMSPASTTTNDEGRMRLVTDIASDSAEVLPPFSDGEGIAFTISTNVATARN